MPATMSSWISPYAGKRVVQGPSLAEVFIDLHFCDVVEQTQTNVYKGPGSTAAAREVEEIPMCANCMIGVEEDNPETVVQKAIRRVERTDAGLSRQRWERLAATKVGKIQQSDIRVQRPTTSPSAAQTLPAMNTGQDGIVDYTNSHDSCIAPLESTIYVNMKDPIGLPAFKPNPTKPIPQQMLPHWMKMLPNQRETAQEPRSRPILNERFEMKILDTFPSPIIEESETIGPTAAQTPTLILSPHAQERIARTTGDQPLSIFSPATARSPPITIPQARGLKIVSTESLQRPSNVSRKSTGDDSKSLQGSGMTSFSTSPQHTPSRTASVQSEASIVSDYYSRCPTGSPDMINPNPPHVGMRTPSPFSQVTAYMKAKIGRSSPPRIKHKTDSPKSKRSDYNIWRVNTASLAVAGRGRVRRIGKQQQPPDEPSRRDSGQSRPSVEFTNRTVSRLCGSPRIEELSQGAKVVQTRGDLKRNTAQGDLWKVFGRGQSSPT
ncbi:hypothetical protein G7054_g449 [Neopestalotiopsis clavispora]|nr:hypothetical protein G7054_g449 [Neopestalotiopsis clavispora]